MNQMLHRSFFVRAWTFFGVLSILLSAAAQQASTTSVRQFPPGHIKSSRDLPPGRFRDRLDNLPESARQRAVAWLNSFHFTEFDLKDIQADTDGGIYYADSFDLPPASQQSEPVTSQAAVPVSPFPSSLHFHSRPGSQNVLYIDFDGENVTGTQWNTDLGRATIPAVAFDTDSDNSTFSDAEQAAIKRVWQRMAEDYAPFDIDVTTQRPATFTSRTAHALITRNTDANGAANPADAAGGVAYVNVFANALFYKYRPAWIYFNNLGNDESYIAEAASHEIGHNLGLSHDGTSTDAYYGGHGGDQTSWGPLMGTGYYRNVSQWSKGEYYQANNTEDDLAIIAAKTPYIPDDHGGTTAQATALRITGGTNILSTTPETDPAREDTFNKGVIERNTDVDVFSFSTGAGAVSLQVNSWVNPAGTRGGNLDVSVELLNSAGAVLLSNDPPALTSAAIQTNLAEGIYYLRVRNTGAGSPLSPTPSGYTAYASIGQYFISGAVRPSSLIIPPQATLQIADITQASTAQKQFTVTYTDDVAIDVSTISSADARVTGPRGYDVLAQLVSIDTVGNGTPRTATYSLNPPDGVTWKPSDNGIYSVFMRTNEVGDTEGAKVAAGQLGSFQVNLTTSIYMANMDVSPGWTLGAGWEYGAPTQRGGPASGSTGAQVIAYRLGADYESKLAMVYATTPPIDCSAGTTMTLRFARWLGVKSDGIATIDISTNGTTWVNLWTSSGNISDGQWIQAQYALPAWANNAPALRLRWGMGSSKSPTDIGWNLDDVELLAGGIVDASPPTAALSASDVTSGGSPSHSVSVAYSDNLAVNVSTLGAGDLLVTGPNNYSNVVTFAGVDDSTDGTPRTAVYTIDAPGGAWDAADNGIFTVTLRDAQVADTSANMAPGGALGSFTVSIPQQLVSVAIFANPSQWGSVSPPGGSYPAGSSLQLTAVPAQHFRFALWSGALAGAANPSSLVLYSNVSVIANFAEILTTNYSVPHWWLAANGYPGDFENAAVSIGSNGVPVWQSYIAGLVPSNPASRLLLSLDLQADRAILNWSAVSGRVYTLWTATNPVGVFSVLPGASNLPPATATFTNPVFHPNQFYKLEVKKTD